MSLAEDKQIVFGPGGLILDVEENKELLCQIKETPTLSSAHLLKLAKFYKGFPTNVSLGNHLALLAAATLGKVPQEEVFSEYDNWSDFFEDLLDGMGSNLAHENAEGASTVQLSMRRVVVSGIGLLIETVDFSEKSEIESWNFVIGVGPAPEPQS